MSNVVKFSDARDRQRADVIPHYADALSFMKRRQPKGSGIDHWAVKPSGNYSLDYKAGRAIGSEYLAFVGRYPTVGHSVLLNTIVRGMATRGQIGGLELGFLSCVNEHAMVGATMLARLLEARRRPT
jgi:hypothetical protein